MIRKLRLFIAKIIGIRVIIVISHDDLANAFKYYENLRALTDAIERRIIDQDKVDLIHSSIPRYVEYRDIKKGETK